MVPSRFALIAYLTTSILLLVSSRGDAQLESIKDQICKQTFDYNFCSSTLHQNLPDGKPTTINDLNDLTKLKALGSVTDTLGFIRASIPRERNSNVLELLKVCEDAYSTVEYSLKQSFMAFNQQDYSRMEGYGRNALVGQSGCYENFNEAPFDRHPVHQMSKEVMILITMDVLAGTYLR